MCTGISHTSNHGHSKDTEAKLSIYAILDKGGNGILDFKGKNA